MTLRQTLILLVPLFFSCSLSYSQVSVSGNSILVDGERYTIRGTCYSPRSIGANWFDYPDLGWPTYTAFATDISLMNEACINTIRTYYAIFDEARLDALAEAGIKVIVTFPYNDSRGNVGTSDRYGMADGSYQTYINTYKNHPAILMWSFGNEMNYFMDDNTWYAALETAAQWVHENDPNHPVTTANGEVPSQDIMENQCPSVDVWGANIYRFGVANTPLGDYVARGGTKPFWYSEIGADSYNHHVNGVDEASQATAFTSMWADIQWSIDNNGVCSGATYFNWTDEWWKSGWPTTHNASGNAPAGIFYPDGVTDEEYYGILNQDRSPKEVFYALKELWGIHCAVAAPATFALEDGECSRHMHYTNYDGGFDIVDNPDPSGVNTSDQCIRYERAPIQYAALVGGTPELTGASDFVNKVFAPTIDVYTSEPNVTVTLNLESSADVTTNYPAGRYAVYSATTTVTNAWERLEFELQDARDANVAPEDVDQIALLFNSGDASDNGVYYFDNLTGPEVTAFVDLGIVSLLQPEPSAVCFSDASPISVQVQNFGSAPLDFDAFPATVSARVSGMVDEVFATNLSQGTLAPDETMDIVVTNAADFSDPGFYSVTPIATTPGDNGCANNQGTSVELQSELCVGLDETRTKATDFIFPNPSTEEVYVVSEEPNDDLIRIIDLHGKLVKEATLPVDRAINIEGIPAGIYFVESIGNNGYRVQQLQIID